jgi:LPS O-antigen subunit length determinant protein (WzzB/FepE family)
MTENTSAMARPGPISAAASLLWRAKWWLLGFAAMGALAGIWVVATAQKVYRAEAVLIPVDVSGRSLDAVSGDLGGLAALAGIRVGNNSGQQVALATLRGKGFTAKFIQEQNLLPTLYPDRWDADQGRWRGEPPTIIQAVDRFDRGGIRKVIENRQSGLITIQIDWKDSEEAMGWLVAMIESLNSQLRSEAIAESRRSVEFLTAESDRTQSTAVRETIFRLIESQMKQAALANAQFEYALKFVDRPLPSAASDYISPRPVFSVCLGLLIGWLAGGGLFLAVETLRSLRRAP